jgi:eukaryotic-like serine/threonine-protein kinase
MAELPHQTIGRYELREEIGRGMMGVVYEAVDPALARTIALKTIKLSFSVGADDLVMFEERFFAEARIAARLSHPGIVVVHDVGRDAQTGTLYIAMERLRGRTLADLISGAVLLDWRAALSIVLRIAEALHHAHTQGVVHRDLKPANIMLLPSGEPKILDFGIAKVETARTKLTTDGQFFGTPLYMSPEQAQGKDLDARSDLFSLGAVAYNLLTGNAAFAGDSIHAIMQRVIEEDPLPPSHFVPDLPDGVDQVIARALAKEPAHRYRDGESLAADIKDILGRHASHEDGLAAPHPSLFEALASELPPASEMRVRAQPVGVATRPGGDMEDELETLVSGLIPLPDLDLSAPVATPPSAPADVASRPVSRWLLVLGLAVVAALVVSGAGAYRWWSNSRPLPKGVPSNSSEPPVVARGSVENSTPAPASPAPPAPAEAARATAPSPSAALAIDFEYPLEDGRLSVWIDGKLSLDQDLAGRTAKNLVGIKIHKGSLEKTLRVRPGGHEVRVRVAWDDNVKEETRAAVFKAGATRNLEIRLGRIRKNLSVEWK